MFSHRNLLALTVVGWLPVAVWISPAAAQIRALPPIIAGVEQPPECEPILFDSIGPIATLPTGVERYIDLDVRPARYVFPSETAEPASPRFGGCFPSETAETVGPRFGDYWTWQVLPDGLMYQSYLAGGREPRLASQWIHERDQGWLWDFAVGGRVGLLRFGTQDGAWPEGWQLDVEAAAFPRVSLERDRDLVATDFRFGVPLTFRQGVWEGKFSYHHSSSHLADEFIKTFPDARRINYVRDAVVLGVAVRPHPDMRWYTEAGWAFYTRGGSRPWEFQFGLDWCPVWPTGLCGEPFFAVNGRIRQEVDFGGSFTMQTGWQWRSRTGHLARLGVHYFNGKADQHQFFNQHEEQIGMGLWYDF